MRYTQVKVKLLSCVQLFATPWTTAYQAPPSMGLSKQEYWSGLPLFSLVKDNEGNDIIHLIDLLSELSDLLNANLIHTKQQ